MTIRPYQSSDLDSCVAIFMSAYNKMPWNYQWKAAGAAQYLQEYIGAPNFVGMVAEDNGVVCGVLFGKLKTWWTGKQFFVDELFIDGSRHGQGIGKQLMSHCETNICRPNNVTTITLMTNKLMPAYEFYISNDYYKVDQYVFMFKELE